MKRFIPFLLICILTAGCKSNEEKALELIQHDLFTTLDDFDSYQPIETTIDSVINSVYYNVEAIAAYYDIESADDACLDLLSTKAKCKIRADELKKSGMNSELWRVNGVIGDLDSLINLECERIRAAKETIKSINDTISPKFMGWKVIHTFRCKNQNGAMGINKLGYFISPDFSKVLEKFDSKTIEEDAEINQQITQIIDSYNANPVEIVGE